MMVESNQTESWFAKCKRILVEQIWLIFLLAPLLIIAGLITQNYQPIKQRVMQSKSYASLPLSVEVTSAELALIVAKPLGELLTMDVYLDYKQTTASNMTITTIGDNRIKSEAYNDLMMRSATLKVQKLSKSPDAYFKS